MNKYQKYFLKDDARLDCFVSGSDTNCSLDRTLEKGIVRIKQNEDISIKKYTLASKYPFEFFCENEWRKSSKLEEGRLWQIAEFDWDCPISKVRFLADNGFADALEIRIKYEAADVETYNRKQEQKRKKDLLTAASIIDSTGIDLVNIYFQPCCNEYEYTEIQLYVENKKTHQWQIFKKCKVSIDDYYLSFGELAFGKYSYVLKQYDKKGNLILETEHIEFTIAIPTINTIEDNYCVI